MTRLSRMVNAATESYLGLSLLGILGIIGFLNWLFSYPF